MLNYYEHKQKQSDKVGVWLIKRASMISNVREHGIVNFPGMYTSTLSADYRYPANVIREDFNLDGLIVESISRSKEKKYALIHLHGGAYVLGYNDTYRKMALRYLDCDDDLRVFSPLYSLAPKHPFPAALEETVRLYKYLIEIGYAPENIMIAGDSAGGGLAIATSLYLRDNNLPLPKALIVMSPWTNLAMNGESHEQNKYIDPLFGEGSKPLNIKAYVRRESVYNPYISPRYGDFTVFTDLLMFVGGDELIKSDTIDISEKAKTPNEVIVHNFLGMFHVFPLAFDKMNSSREAWKIIKEYIKIKFRG